MTRSGPADVPSIGVVVLTQGTRPVELAAALASIHRQRGVTTRTAVVGNGWMPEGLPPGVTGVGLPENLGIPAGRNRGADAVAGEFVFFLDDDAELGSDTFLAEAVERIREDPSIGLLQPRLSPRSGEPAPSRWIPRIRKGEATTSGRVMSCLEAAVLLPRPVFDRAGGWAEPFFYAHEGIELAWRVWDQGLVAWYDGNLVAHHPVVQPTRHASYYRMNARNRVWLAKRNLPAVLVPLYVASWTGIQLLRWWRTPAVLRPWFAGWAEGWREAPGGRRPLRWRTVARMAAAGRPPVI
ncbi:glycosyltransferase [Mycetocola reblochoni]|uniref:Glycosyltransferase n=1 Tax=Mycetocola reblochoni TaxID=331618 RepID=A0A3L6ZQJ3_9MICO|nr:glycosyltransferase [Mycetocola reblochoni]